MRDDPSLDQQKRITKLREVNAILVKNALAHHPNCSEYDHHVIRIGQWRLCLGCTAMYSAFIVVFLLDIFLFHSLIINPWIRFVGGLVCFIPAIFQLKLKSENRLVRFSFRAALGSSIYLLLSFIYYIPSYLIKVPAILTFIGVVWQYSGYQAGRQLRECSTCSYGEQYHTCLVKYGKLLEVEDLHLIKNSVPQVAEALMLQKARKSGEFIDLHMKKDE